MTKKLFLFYATFLVFSVSSFVLPIARWVSPVEQSSRAKRCVSGAEKNKVCTGDRVMDMAENLGEVKAIVSPRLVRVIYGIGYEGVVDYAGLSPSVGAEQCFDNGHGEAICQGEMVLKDGEQEGTVADLFNNQRAIVEMSAWSRLVSLVEDLKTKRLEISGQPGTLSSLPLPANPQGS